MAEWHVMTCDDMAGLDVLRGRDHFLNVSEGVGALDLPPGEGGRGKDSKDDKDDNEGNKTSRHLR